MSVAICDPKAFEPFHRLVTGPLTDLRMLDEVERFVRTVVLHDGISMEMEPMPYGGDLQVEDEENNQLMMVALGPDLSDYSFFTDTGWVKSPHIELSPTLIESAQKFSSANEGNPYYEAHIEFLQNIVAVIKRGGSALLAGKFVSSAIDASSKFPEEWFKNLDQDWGRFAKDAHAGEIGFMVPPVLAIILSRCERREAIPTVLRDLRDEWAKARNKAWLSLNQLTNARTVKEASEIKKRIETASQLFSPIQEGIATRPTRVLWDLAIGSGAGASSALLIDSDPSTAAIGAAIGMAAKSFPPLIRELGPALFNRGAFDLASRVRREVLKVEYDALRRLLTNAEKEELGL